MNNTIIRPFFIYALLNIIFFYSILFGSSNFIIHDNFNFFFPSFIERGIIWNYRLQMGYPVGHDPQFQVFYILKYIFPPTVLGFNFFLIFSVVLASYFAYLLIYKITKHFAGSLFGGLVFGWSGNFIAQSTMAVVLSSSLWLPLVLLLHILLIENRNNKKFFVLNSIVIFMNISSGSPQISIFNLGFAYLYIIFQYRNDKEFYHSLGVTFLSTLVGLLLSSVVIFPTLELMKFSLRSVEPSIDSFNSYSFKLSDFLKIIYPYVFGGLIENEIFNFKSIYQISGVDNFHEHQRYMGIITILIVLLSFKEISSKRLKYFIFFSLSFYIIYSMGAETPIGKLLFNIPLINKFRGPNRHFLEISLLISILSSFGIKRLDSINLPSRNEKVIFLIGLLALFLILILGINLNFDLKNKYNLSDFFGFSGNNLITYQLFLVFTTSFLFFLYHYKVRFKYIYIFHFILFLDLFIVSRYQDWFILNRKNKDVSDIELKISELAKDSFVIFSKSLVPFKIEDYYNQSYENIYLTNNLNNNIKLRSFSIYSPLSIYDNLSLNNLIIENPLLGQIFSIKYFNTYYQSNISSVGNSTIFGRCNGISTTQFKNNSFKFFKNINENKNYKLFISFSILCMDDFSSKDNFKIIFRDDKLNSYITHISSEEFESKISKCNNPSNFGLKFRINKNKCSYIFEREVELPPDFIPKDMIIESEKAIIIVYSMANKSKDDIYYTYNHNYDDFKNQKIINENNGALILEFENTFPEFYFSNNLEIKSHQEIFSNYKEKILLKNNLITTYIESEDTLVANKVTSLEKNSENKDRFIIKTEKNNHYLTLNVKLDYDSFLVLNHTYFPGWKAFIDNKEVDIIKTNYIMRGLFVPKGEHLIQLKYEPTTIFIGGTITIVTCILLLIYYLIKF